MTYEAFLTLIFSFPTSFFSIPFIIFFVIMLIDIVFDFIDGLCAEIEFVDLDSLLEGGLLIPPVLSKVPLMIAASVTMFIATIIEFYLASLLLIKLPSGFQLAADIASIPLVLFASLHIAAVILNPLQPLFCKQNAFARIEFIGLRATAQSSKVDSDLGGEALVIKDGNEVLLNVKTEGDQIIHYGEEMVIVAQEEDKRTYIVAKK